MVSVCRIVTIYIALFLVALNCVAETVSPKIRLELYLASSDVSEFRNILYEFAKSEGLSIEDIGAVLPPREGRMPFYIKLDFERKVEIRVTDFLTQNKFFIAFYDRDSGESFQEIAMRLERMLQARWPDKLVPYNGM